MSLIREKLNSILNESLPPSIEEFQDRLKDGTLLCRAMNVLRPGCIKRIHTKPGIAAMAEENIGFFLASCTKELNIKPQYLFQPADLYKGGDKMPKVASIILEVLIRTLESNAINFSNTAN